jgi:hypothetical protein
VVLEPPVMFLRYLLTPLYAVSFGLINKHFAKKAERRLADDLQLAVKFLFVTYHARIVPNHGLRFPPPNDYAVVTIAVENLLIRFFRGLGELGVNVAPDSNPSDWHDLSLVLGVIDGSGPLHRGKFRDVWQAATALQNSFPKLIEVFSVERFPELKHRLELEFYVYERLSNRQWEIETNARLYGGE